MTKFILLAIFSLLLTTGCRNGSAPAGGGGAPNGGAPSMTASTSSSPPAGAIKKKALGKAFERGIKKDKGDLTARQWKPEEKEKADAAADLLKIIGQGEAGDFDGFDKALASVERKADEREKEWGTDDYEWFKDRIERIRRVKSLSEQEVKDLGK